MRRLLALTAPILLIALIAAACGDDDDDDDSDGPTATATTAAADPTATTEPAQVDPTATTVPDPTATTAATEPAAPLVLESTAFAEGDPIPVKHACDGDNVSPALSWSGLPAGTEELALIVDDPDAPGGSFIHWVLYALPSTETGLEEGAQLGSSGPNGTGQDGYFGPCPPPGDGDHRYEFTLYALSGALRFVQAPTANDLRGAIADITLAETTLTGLYSR